MRGTLTVLALLAVTALGACTEHTARSTARGGLIGGGVGLVAGALYGKVLTRLTAGRYLLHFTSVPPPLGALLASYVV